MRYHQPTVDYVASRRCLKRFLAREIYQRVMTDFRARQEIIQGRLNECLDISGRQLPFDDRRLHVSVKTGFTTGC